jgi:hypothetical protein
VTLPAPSAWSLPGPEVSLSFPDGPPRFGELARAEIAVANGHIRPMLVRGIELSAQLPETEAWLLSLEGRVEWKERPPSCEYVPGAAGITPAVFAAGLLFPGESLSVERWVRVRGSVQGITVSFQLVPEADVASLYFDADVLRPARRSSQRVTFRPASLSELGKLRKLALGSEERWSVVPYVGEWPVESRRRELAVQFADPGSAAAILADLGGPGGEVSRWDAGDAWIVRTPEDGAVHVFPAEGDVRRLDRLGLEVFDLIDIAAAEGVAVLLRDETRASQPAGGDTGDEGGLEGASMEELAATPAVLDRLAREMERGRRVDVGIDAPLGPQRRLCIVVRR